MNQYYQYCYHALRSKWHRLVCRIFSAHINDVLTDYLHPEFGFIWADGGEVDVACKEAYKQGFNDGRKSA